MLGDGIVSLGVAVDAVRRTNPDVEEFWSDLTAAYADQVRKIHTLGCTYLQFDDRSRPTSTIPTSDRSWPHAERTASTCTRHTSASPDNGR
jgi:methionine synthase II (cobalamin-independent)